MSELICDVADGLTAALALAALPQPTPALAGVVVLVATVTTTVILLDRDVPQRQDPAEPEDGG
ncbi:MAG: hypothetical protein ERJ67_01295 [Aphanocapsa feldmannii 277cV]|uniref:Uncharacterized protein n=2 Tax=Aphanocapsa feldmannii TaxID=192050 RepID=A0A524RQW1_9CHRO|nr:MAG: hypothetical protein ERJ69_02675 [Aphanocapsa feldmannii 288cV]TGG96193.1 MAG: hypothetical protein ERJ67_01295 [Aphanocapsa feldmannii 277cV]TGH21325.1 MAG: hypothetical protein ERJ68_05575 [Aphanocapsa feldmannii 277cI]